MLNNKIPHICLGEVSSDYNLILKGNLIIMDGIYILIALLTVLHYILDLLIIIQQNQQLYLFIIIINVMK